MNSPYIDSPGILAEGVSSVAAVRLDYGTADVLKAGQPISEAGAAVNDGSAFGVLAHDCHKGYDVLGPVVIMGRIKQAVAAAWSGVTISDAAKGNMKNVTFTGDTYTPDLPEIEDGDAGKVLSVVEDEEGALSYGLVEAGGGSDLPEIEEGDEGKVLGVVEDEEGALSYGLVEAGGGSDLPDPSELPDGTVLVVKDGAWVAGGEVEDFTFTVNGADIVKHVLILPDEEV